MGLCSLVTRRNGIYIFRKRVPDDLQDILGKKTIKKSLGTTKPEEAKKQRALVEAEIMELFAAKRAERDGMAYTPASSPIIGNSIIPESQSNATVKGRGLTIQAIFDIWAKNKHHHSRNKESAEVSIARYQQKLDVFKESQGDILIGDITLDTQIAFREHLTITTKHKSKTINGYLTAVHAIVSFAMDERYIHVHPLKGAKYHAKENDSESRIPYEKSDLEALFLNSSYASLRQSAPPKFWIPLIALFTGARIEEIAQLTYRDVKEDKDIYYFDINERSKPLKTKSSIRKVPIHPELLRFGLLKYVYSQQAKPNQYIFPDLIPCENRRAHSISKWFSEYKKQVGINDPLKVFHSFRHTLIDACRAAGISEDKCEQLAGHGGKSVHRRYGYGHHVRGLYPELCKVDYRVDFSSLHTIKIDIPLSPITPGSIQKTKCIPSLKELKEAVSLAEAYQQIGKAHFGKEWIDYQICERRAGKWLKTSLKNTLNNKHKGRPEIRALTPVDRLKWEPALNDEVIRHTQIINFLEKCISSITAYGKVFRTSQYEILDDDAFINAKLPNGSLLMSWYDLISPTGEYQRHDIRLNRESLVKAVINSF